MTADEIVEVVSAYKLAYITGKKYGVSTCDSIHNLKLADLRLARKVYGGHIKHYDDWPEPFYTLDVGEVTLYT